MRGELVAPVVKMPVVKGSVQRVSAEKSLQTATLLGFVAPLEGTRTQPSAVAHEARGNAFEAWGVAFEA
jgi:hypothetical protein